MLDVNSPLSAARRARTAIVVLAVLVLLGLGVSQVRAQSNDDSYDDGSYPSDSSGGYAETDDEDGYEDGQDAPDVSYFYDQLENDGEWVSDDGYGQVWRPRNVESDWRPYTRGTWANTEEHGWYWVSDEPFGWATYHYGRWHLHPRYGWVWVPGTRWGPAWVTWRSNDEHIGWAPLPPEARWEHGSGLRFESRIYEEPSYEPYWSFVEYRYITSPRIYSYCAPRPRVTTYLYSSRPADSYVFVNRRIVNRGISVTRIETVTRTRITTVRVRASENRSYRNVTRNSNVLNVYRPKLTRAQVKNRQSVGANRADFRDVDQRPQRGIARQKPNDRALAPLGIPNSNVGGTSNKNRATTKAREFYGDDGRSRSLRNQVPGYNPQGAGSAVGINPNMVRRQKNNASFDPPNAAANKKSKSRANSGPGAGGYGAGPGNAQFKNNRAGKASAQRNQGGAGNVFNIPQPQKQRQDKNKKNKDDRD